MARDDTKILELMAAAIAHHRETIKGLVEAEAPGGLIRQVADGLDDIERIMNNGLDNPHGQQMVAAELEEIEGIDPEEIMSGIEEIKEELSSLRKAINRKPKQQQQPKTQG